MAETIQTVSIATEARTRFIRYAMSVVTGRALPDIRDGLKGHGYADVRLRRDLGGDHVEVLARDDGWIYSMRLDRCNGEVDRIERLRPTLGEGFGFQFDYGTDDKDEQGDLK